MATKKPRRVRTDKEKTDDFKKVAGKHANTALMAIVRLGKCARPGRYSWTPVQVDKLDQAFRAALSATFEKLKRPPTAGKATAALIDL